MFLQPSDWSSLNQLKGINILLSDDEHCLGRCVEDRFQISDPQISSKHCMIYRDTVLGELNRHEPVPVFLKDTRFFFSWMFLYLIVLFPFLSFTELYNHLWFCSSNGTYVNWKRIKKNSSPVKLNHGDIISFIAPHTGKILCSFQFH